MNDQIPQTFQANFGVLNEKDFQKLTNIHVLVIGVGGIGGNLVNGLIRLGVQHVTLVDFDTFDATNLNRQLFSHMETINYPKCTIIQQELLKINPNLLIRSFSSRIQEIGEEEFYDVDYIMDAVDDIPTKLYIEDLATELDIPVLHGSCAGWYAQVGWIMPGKNVLHKLYQNQEKGIEQELMNPPFAPSATASYMVSEFLKMIQQSPNTVINELLLIDLDNNELHRLKPE